MLLDIRKYLSRENVDLSDSFSLTLKDKSFLAELTLPETVDVLYSCKSHGNNGLDLKLEIAFTADAQCARCLAEFKRSYRFEPSYTLYKEDYECEEPELPFSPDGKLDLEELCYTEILLGLPSVILCSSQCQGLCPVCGKPRSEGCGCDHDADGGRQSVFHQLLS